MGRVVVRSVLGAVAVVAVLVLAGVGYRAVEQHRRAKAAEITTPNGIDEARFVRIGGLDQWITIRGQDRSNPVLLILDGGPGAASSQDIPSGLEKDFTVVGWDQPGAGKTFGRAGRRIGPDVGIDSIAGDGIGVAEYARRRLGRGKVGLFAVSFGTIIGVHMIRLRPDLFYAYVGSGQVVNMRRGEALDYWAVLAEANARDDLQAMQELEHSLPPPYRSITELRTQRKWAMAYEAGAPNGLAVIASVLSAPRYSLTDASNWMAGFLASQEHFFGEAVDGPGMDVDLPALGTDFAVPFFVFQGIDDHVTPFALAKAYVDSVRAPQKLLIAIPGAGHSVAASHAGDFRKFMVERVRPLGLEAG